MCSTFWKGEGRDGMFGMFLGDKNANVCPVLQEKNFAKAISTARWRRRRR